MLKIFSYCVILLILIKPLCGKDLRLETDFNFEKFLKIFNELDDKHSTSNIIAVSMFLLV